jgi:hypothetical protein
MRTFFVTILLAAALAAAAPAADGNWVSLFDGKTFAHWEDPARKSPPGDSFVIEDGCLKAVAHPRITEDLFSSESYEDFELEFDWRISPGGNTGLKYRIQDHVFLLDQHLSRFEDEVNAAVRNRRTDRPSKGQDYVIGFEYQLIDNQRNPDALRGGALHRTGALYDMFSPWKDATNPVGEFNHSRLVVKGDHVEHWLNGVKVVEASLKDPEIAQACAKRWGVNSAVYNLLVHQPRKSCPISLQNHGAEAWFRNIRIRRLD